MNIYIVVGVAIASDCFVCFVGTSTVVNFLLLVPYLPTNICHNASIKVVIGKKNDRTILPKGEVQRTVAGMKRVLGPPLVFQQFLSHIGTFPPYHNRYT